MESMQSSRRHQEEGILLRLPPELRLKVYSYLLPINQPLSVSRSLRQTCRQVNRELQHEIRKDFERQMDILQERYKPVTLSYDSDTFHVASDVSSACWELVERFLDGLPTTTRSLRIIVNFTLRRPFCKSLQPFEDCLRKNFSSKEDEARAGERHLRGFSLCFGRPVLMEPVLCSRYFSKRLQWIKLAGLAIDYNKIPLQPMQSVALLEENQRLLFLKRAVLKLLPRLGNLKYRLVFK